MSTLADLRLTDIVYTCVFVSECTCPCLYMHVCVYMCVCVHVQVCLCNRARLILMGCPHLVLGGNVQYAMRF